MTGTHYEVAPLSWRLFTWLGINEACQLFNTLVTEENLMKRRGLPVSNMAQVAIHLKTYKNIPEVTGMPEEWYGQSNYHKEREADWENPRHHQGRDKCRPEDFQSDQKRGITPYDDMHPMI